MSSRRSHRPPCSPTTRGWRRVLRDAPEGTTPSLEGFLWPGTYRVLPDTTPEELIRRMLDGFIAAVGEDKLTVPQERGLTFYQVLSLASIVEREAVLDEERPLIAGVYQNRIDGIPGIKNKILNADPTVIYGVDTVKLSELDFETWKDYVFWKVPEGVAHEGHRAARGAARLPDLHPARASSRPRS